MRGRRLLLTLAVFGLFTAGFTGTVAADATLSITGTSLPDTVTQGDSFDLTVSLSGEELQNDEVDVSLTLPDGISCSPSGTQTVTLSGGTGDATFDCTAEAEGDYTGEITVTATATNVNNGNSLSASTQTGLTVQSPASLSLTTSLDNASVSVDGSTTLTAVVQNTGDASTSYTFSISTPSGVSASVASGSTSGTVSGGSTASIEYTVTGKSNGSYDITTSVSGGNGQSLSRTDTLTVADTTAPTADAGSDFTVDEGATFSFDASASSDNDAISTYEWDVDGDGTYELSGAQPTHSFSSTGDKTVTLRVTDGAGNAATDTVTVTVQSTGGGGGGGGTQSSGPTRTVVSAVRTSASGGVTATIDQVTLDDPRVTITTEGVSTGGISVERASATFGVGTSENNEMTVDASASPPENVPAFDGGDRETLGYVTVTVAGNLDGHVSEGSFVVRLDRGKLSTVAAADVTVRRYHDGEWQTVETTPINDSVVEVVTPGYSTFVITAEPQDSATPTGTTTTADPSTPSTTAPPPTTSSPPSTSTRPPGTETEPGATDAPPSESTSTGTGTAEPTPTSGAGSPGYGPVTALVALAGLAALLARRR